MSRASPRDSVLGPALRALRGTRSLHEIGDAAGVSHVAVSHYERGIYTPSRTVLGRLAAALGGDVHILEGLAELDIVTAWRASTSRPRGPRRK